MNDPTNPLDLAYEAGSILLENGAEISRVEETMRRIASHYGVEDEDLFVLSNGIIATDKNYARSKFIPIKGASLDKVVAVNQLSRKVEQGEYSLEQLEYRLKQIRAIKAKPAWEQILASAVGSAAFCIIFGGSFMDSLASFIAGLVLWVFMLFVASKRLSRIVGNVTGGLLATLVCFGLYRISLGEHLSNMIIGAIIPLIPGVAFTNGIRDMANEDYIASVTRLLDAMLTFFCIALGVALAFMFDENVFGKMLLQQGLTNDSQTAGIAVQLVASFLGTVSFAALFGVPRKYYFDTGFCGTMGWLLYLMLSRYTAMSPAEVLFCATFLVASIALLQSKARKCPITVFLISGIFPLVPGAGIFWTSYNIVSNQLTDAFHTGFAALKATVAIAFGILAVMELNGKGQLGRWIKSKRK